MTSARARRAAPRSRPTRADALALAVKTFAAGQRVEVQDLATALSVDRVTIYRWLGDRDQLLAEALWTMAESAMLTAYEQAGGRGRVRIAETASAFCQMVIADGGMQAFLAAESATALRVLTSRSQPFQARLVDLVQKLLVQEEEAGGLGGDDIALRDLAYVCVRVGESFIYTDTITGEAPDADRASRAMHYLLR